MDISEPKVLRVEAKEIHVVIEMSLDFMKTIKKVMDMSELNYDSTDPEQEKIREFLQEEYYPFIAGTIEGIERQS